MRKGQAAVEFLMVHGWAILVLLIILATLYSLGVLNPGSYTNEECVFLPGFDCKFYILQKTSTGYVLNLIVTNGLGFDISLVDVNATARGIGSEQTKIYTATGTPSFGTIIKQGSEAKLTFQIPFDAAAPSVPEVGEFTDMRVRVIYRNCAVATQANCADGAEHIVSGRIVARIEPG